MLEAFTKSVLIGFITTTSVLKDNMIITTVFCFRKYQLLSMIKKNTVPVDSYAHKTNPSKYINISALTTAYWDRFELIIFHATTCAMSIVSAYTILNTMSRSFRYNR
ncbi:uncharacterized protein V1516DRAFT_669144 [Lipomyces oligophaga]|uniref:uncharacterized protein n=1 Tax=Lipomyces oligophaga TaxID=45792 RepID=UPI0034CFE4F9